MSFAAEFEAFTARIVDTEAAEDRPIFLVNLNEILEKVDRWRRNFPRIKPFYAMKCNDVPQVIELLARVGVGFDCASIVSPDLLRSTGLS